MSMRFFRRKRDRQASELARLFVALDAAARAGRPWGARPKPRFSISATR